MARLIDADLFMQRIESYNTLDESDKALYNFALNEIVCMPTVDVLDKIRAEIDELEIYYDNDYFSGNRDAMFKCNDVMQIIDKYKGDKE